MDIYMEMTELEESVLRFNSEMPYPSYWMGEAWEMFGEYLNDWREEVRDFAMRCLMRIQGKLSECFDALMESERESHGGITLDEDEEVEEIDENFLLEHGYSCACTSYGETEIGSVYISLFSDGNIEWMDECDGDRFYYFPKASESYLVAIRQTYCESYEYEFYKFNGEEFVTMEKGFSLSDGPFLRDMIARVGDFTTDLCDRGFVCYD